MTKLCYVSLRSHVEEPEASQRTEHQRKALYSGHMMLLQVLLLRDMLLYLSAIAVVAVYAVVVFSVCCAVARGDFAVGTVAWTRLL